MLVADDVYKSFGDVMFVKKGSTNPPRERLSKLQAERLTSDVVW